MATEPEDTEQHIVTLADPQEEYSVDQITQQSENEAQGAVESFSIYSTQTTSEPEEHNHTTSPQLDEDSHYRDSTTPTSTERYLESTEVTWQKEIYIDPKHMDFTQKGEPDIKASAVDGVKSSNHRHYQPMPDTNLQPGEPIDFMPPTETEPETTEDLSSQPKEIDGFKHFQPMPETNLEYEDKDRVTSEISMTTEDTTLEYDSSSAITTQHASVQSSTSIYLSDGTTVEENAGKLTETQEPDEDHGLFTHTTQSMLTSTSSTEGLLEGSGEDLTLLSIQKAEHLVTSHKSETYGASTSETESFSLTHLNSISPSK